MNGTILNLYVVYAQIETEKWGWRNWNNVRRTMKKQKGLEGRNWNRVRRDRNNGFWFPLVDVWMGEELDWVETVSIGRRD